jgi:hypothetical protein
MKSLLHAVLVIALGSGLVAAASPAKDDNTYFYLVHAASGRIFSSAANPELPVDISINGKCVVEGISFGDIRGPYAVSPGTFSFQVSMADSTKPCSNSPIFSGSSSMFVANTYVAVVSLDASNALTGQVYSLDLSSISPGAARAFVVNATARNLIATATSVPTTDGSGPHVSVPAGTLQITAPPLGISYTSIYIDQTDTLQAGPIQTEALNRNAYIYVFAGSASNGTVQLIGPKRIYGVY